MRSLTLSVLMVLLLTPSSWLAAQDARGDAQSTAQGRQAVSITGDYEPGTIVVSLDDRRLYHILRRGEAISYPIATPRDQDMWTGSEYVTRKMANPPWRPTPTMMRENPRLPSYVPGGHRYNPMGARALYLGDTYYRIHGTDAPWLIGENISKGCIRMHNEHVIELFEKTEVGAKVVVTQASLVGAGNTRSTRAAVVKRPVNGS
ncbi:MAG: L,D-transpeptidase [Alphaproteobacteria bacterium]|nr:L,D-transpeptidase [Alphaproteobacteria bacterium]